MPVLRIYCMVHQDNISKLATFRRCDFRQLSALMICSDSNWSDTELDVNANLTLRNRRIIWMLMLIELVVFIPSIKTLFISLNVITNHDQLSTRNDVCFLRLQFDPLCFHKHLKQTAVFDSSFHGFHLHRSSYVQSQTGMRVAVSSRESFICQTPINWLSSPRDKR